MRKLLIAAILMTGMASFAQDAPPPPKKNKMEQLTPDQRNQLRLKKLTLDLGLNASQQKDMGKLIADQSAKMEAAKADRKAKVASGTKPTADERFTKENQMLDEQIAMKEKVKKILTPEQFDKWEKMQKERKHDWKERGGKRRLAPEDNPK